MTYSYCFRPITSIVGYVFRADIVCPDCILSEMRKAGLPVSAHLDTFQVEAAVNSVAADLGIDPEDESSFDSGDFPKVIFHSDDSEQCGACGATI